MNPGAAIAHYRTVAKLGRRHEASLARPRTLGEMTKVPESHSHQHDAQTGLRDPE